MEHVDILSADCHEPKHITNATTADAGKVITPSSSVSSTSELRALQLGEYDYILSRSMTDIQTPTIDYIPVPVDSTLAQILLVTSGATTTTATTTITFRKGVSGTVIGTIAVPSGTTVGTVFTLNTSQTFSSGDVLEIDSDGGGAGVTRGNFVYRFNRNA